MQNKQIRLASRPTGMPTAETFQFTDADVPKPNDGEVLLKTIYMSVDPYLRGRMRDRKSYVAPFEVGQVIENAAVGKVVESRSPVFQPGDIAMGMLPWQLYATADARKLQKINPSLAPVQTSLGVLAMPGLTAYFGLLDITQPQSGETVVVSGAAGAVGGVVCQIAKIKGCRVVGIAGGDDKKQYLLDELGLDAAINYKSASGAKSFVDLRDELAQSCPEGVNIYFDNVGGEISDAVMTLLTTGARVSVCGQISMYNLDKPDIGLRPQPFLLMNRATMKGFIIFDYAPRYAEGIRDLGKWVAEGKIKYAETVVEGFENAPKAFLGLFKGENIGKALVKVPE